MTHEELLMLVKAGYTKEEINAMTAPAPAEEPKEEPAPAPAEEPKETPAEVSEFAEMRRQFAEMNKEISNIVKGLQKMNVANARQGEPTNNTVDDILKNMLNPSGGGK